MLWSLLFLPIIWSVIAAGRTLTYWLRMLETATRLERTVIALGFGLGLLAYGILVLGLLGLLYPLAGLLWVLALAGLGARQHGLMVQELRATWHPQKRTLWEWGVAILFAAFGLIALIGVYAPPVLFIPGVNATEWDSLSYHLADPKIFLQVHRIVSLPWQPHSNFAFTTEMWYTLALMAHGSVPLAKWFSWICAAGTTLAIYALGARHLSARVGLWAALLFASTPLVFGAAGTAYIDGATTFYIALAVLCAGNGMEANDRRWLWGGAILAGLAVSTKASALMFLFALAIVLLIWEGRTNKSFGLAVARTLGWSGLALAVGSPWYLKAWACTGNPVYPYFYRVFGGHWWNAHMADAYAGANRPGPGHTLTDALLLPWNLIMALPPGHLVGPWPPFNEFPSALLSVSPVLLAALFYPVFGLGQTPRAVKALALFAFLGTVLWFSQTQYIRFLMPLVPAFCLLTAWVLCQSVAARTISGYVLSALMAASLLWSLSVGAALVGVQAPAALGLQSRSSYLARYEGDIGAFQYINSHLPPDSKVVFFGHPLGFYCDRSYLWGDQSTYVLTPDVHSAQALWSRLHTLGVTHILVDTQYFPLRPSNSPSGWVDALTAARTPPLYPNPSDPNRGISVYVLPAQP